jgi:hypothetical protein
LLLFDDFNYAVSRNPSTLPGNASNPFVTTGPWTSAKAINISGSHNGYLYTVTAPEMAATTGYSGPLPNPSSRALKIEHPAASTQSDFYLEYGRGANSIPANVWFQFWIYPNHYGSERGGILGNMKFLYPTNDGYGSHTNKWLLYFNSWAAAPQFGGNPYGNPTAGQAFLTDLAQMGSTPRWNNDTSNGNKLGPNLLPRDQSHIPPNQWTQVKIHYDHSVANRGTFEVWLRPLNGQWRKTHEWIGGVTPNFTWGGFTPGGHEGFRMPTTIPGTADSGGPSNPGVFLYVQDFAMASSESSLPDYDGTRPRSPANVTAE